MIVELLVILVAMTMWFTRLENRVDNATNWMIHHIQDEHKERAKMHHREMGRQECMNCKGVEHPSTVPQTQFR